MDQAAAQAWIAAWKEGQPAGAGAAAADEVTAKAWIAAWKKGQATAPAHAAAAAPNASAAPVAAASVPLESDEDIVRRVMSAARGGK